MVGRVSESISKVEGLNHVSPNASAFSVDAPTYVSCDASGTALEAVLSQIQKGVERPVAFAFRALREVEKKYAV